MEVFDGMRAGLAKDRSQFYKDLAIAVLRRQPAGRQGLAGHAGSVLALEHAGRPQERLREHQGVLRDRLHRGPQEVRRPDAGPARRGRPDRARQGLGDEVGPAHQGREGNLLPGRAARHHGHASGSGQRRPIGLLKS